MKKYEAVFILDSRKVEGDGESFATEFAKKIADLGGAVTETVKMGKKDFAREINKRKSGVYIDFVFDLDPAEEKGLRDLYKLDERVLRLLVILFDRPAKVRTALAAPEATTEEQR